jgi:hypothetical protein
MHSDRPHWVGIIEDDSRGTTDSETKAVDVTPAGAESTDVRAKLLCNVSPREVISRFAKFDTCYSPSRGTTRELFLCVLDAAERISRADRE